MAGGSRIEVYRDPDAFPARVNGARISVLPQQAGDYRARVTSVRLVGVNLLMAHENLARILQAERLEDRLYFRLKRAGDPASLVNGEPEPPGSIAVRQCDRIVVERTPGPSVIRTLSISRCDLAARSEALLGRRPAGLDPQTRRLLPDAAAFTRLAAVKDTAFRLAAVWPAALERAALAAALDAALGEALLVLLDGAAPLQDRAAQRRGDLILRRAEACIEADPSHPPSLTALCAAAGCSAKTLEVLFRDRFGVPPLRYLRFRSLWMARRALLAADPQHARVTEIALDCGFWELGRFAGAYRAMFGEVPSATLHRKRESGLPSAVFTISE